MPRNDDSRLGVQSDGDSPAVSQDAQSLLNFVIPTEFVDLPTKGKFYPAITLYTRKTQLKFAI